MTPITDMVRALFAAGCSQEQILIAIEGAERARPVDIPVDRVAQRRREYDRERKRKSRKTDNVSGGIPPDSADSGGQALILEESKIKKESKKVSKSRKTQIPPDWQPTVAHLQLGTELNVPIVAAEEGFRDYCAANGKLYADHNAAFCNYIRNYHRFNGARHNGTHRPTLAERAIDLARQARERELEFNYVSEADLF